MRRDTLLDFFDDLASRSGTFLVYDDGFRTRQWTYAEVGHAAYAFAARLQAAGLSRGDKILIWAENRPEWIVAFWGALLNGVAVVPIDFRASADFLLKVRSVVEARIVLVGDDVTAPTADGFTVWHLHNLAHDDVHGANAGPSPAITNSREAREQHLRDVRAQTTKDDVVEIIFTSGATAEPKGVVITHRNILANIVPIEREIVKYRRYARPFQPIRFLNLLPLSHMFGQAMATFVPPMLTGEVIFMRSYNPQEIMREIKSHRVSVLVSVPKLLDVLRDYVSRRFPHAATPDPAKMHFTKRWWKYRDVHRAFGWKFWSAVVGAAPLDPGLEEYWGRLGFLVIQGYGLTETAPIVTLNHPFSAQKGSVGKPIHGVEVKIAEDGEILVRGENVTTGYYGQPEATADAFEDGWLHTGDIGGVDEAGRVFIRGRKKEMIVTPEGLNVFPEDVERELNAIGGVRESAVIGRNWQGEERVHAVLVVEPGTDVEAVVREANAKLGDHQKIRSHAIWPSETLPRTEGTRKLKRREIKSWVDAGGAPDAVSKAAGRDESIEAIVARFAKSRSLADIGRDTTIDELGLSSLERVELLMALEDRFQTTLDEAAYAEVKTVGDLHLLVAEAVGGAVGRDDSSLHAEDFAAADVANQSVPGPPGRGDRRAAAAASGAGSDGGVGPGGGVGSASGVGPGGGVGSGSGVGPGGGVGSGSGVGPGGGVGSGSGVGPGGVGSGGGTGPAAHASKTLGGGAEPVVFPSWNRTLPARAVRRVSLPTWILPLGRAFAWLEVRGLEHLQGLQGPVMFAANHQSHLDAPMILWALPARWRYRTAIAMAKEFFKAHFFPERHGRKAWATNSLNYYLASLFFNAFPLPQREAGTRQTLRYIGDLLSGGWNVLIFPEGKRTDKGEINPFRPGIGMIGARLGVPVVPVRLIGLDRVLHQKWKMAKPGPAKVVFGKPLMLTGDDYVALAKEVEDAVRALGEDGQDGK